MKPNVRGINLLPKEYIQAQKIRIYMLIATGLLFLECIVFVFTVVLPPIEEIKMQEQNIASLQNALKDPRYVEVEQVIQQLQAATADIQKWTDKINNVKTTEAIKGELFDKLITRLPQGVTIDTMQVKADVVKTGVVILKGKTTDPHYLLNYVAIIETLYKGVEVSFQITNEKKDDNYQTYDISFTMPQTQVVPEQAPTEAVSPDATAADASAQEVSEGGTES